MENSAITYTAYRDWTWALKKIIEAGANVNYKNKVLLFLKFRMVGLLYI